MWIRECELEMYEVIALTGKTDFTCSGRWFEATCKAELLIVYHFVVNVASI